MQWICSLFDSSSSEKPSATTVQRLIYRPTDVFVNALVKGID